MVRIVVIVVILVAGSSTYADPAALRQEAKRLRDEGTEAMRVSDFAHAADCFQRAYELYPSPNLRFNIGVALDKLGRVAEAVDAFEEFLEATPEAADEAHRFAGARLAKLAPQVARLELTVEPAGATVRVDGQRVRWPRPGGIPVAVGERRVRAEQRGRAPAEQQVTATLDGPVTLTLRLAPLPPDPPAPRPALVRPRVAAAPRVPLYRRWWVWTAASAVTVAVALGVGLGVGLRSDFASTLPPISQGLSGK
jgi:hypothetical protein